MSDQRHHEYYLVNRNSIRVKNAAWALAHPRTVQATGRRSYEKRRNAVLDILGPWCAFCGETDRIILQVDHKIPLMAGSNGRTIGRLYRTMLDGKESPFNLQILCATCHMRKTAMERQCGISSHAPAIRLQEALHA